MKKILLFLLISIVGYGQTSTGQEQEFDYGIKNNSTQTVTNPNTLVTQGSDGTYGKASVNNIPISLAVIDSLKLKSYLSTGLIKNGLVTTNADPTKFNITAGIGIISNFDDPENPICKIINFPAFTGITPTYLLTSNITYVAINSSASVVMQATPFTNIQRRDLIALGAVIHSNLTTINLVNNISAPTNAGTNQLHDLMEAIGALNISGNKYIENGANLSLNKSAGIIFKLGVNFANNWKDPNNLSIASGTALTFRYRTQNGTESGDLTVLNPSVYDLANVLTSVPSNRFTIQTVTLFQTGQTRIQYGQQTYATLADAEAAIVTRSFVVEPNIAANGIVRAYIILRNNATDLTNTTTSKIIEAQKFGGVASGGVAVSSASIIAALGYTPANVVDVVDLNTNQTILGDKTFSDNIRTDSDLEILDTGTIKFYNGIYSNTLDTETLTANQTISIPNDSGTLALTKLTVRKISTNTTLANSDNGTIILLTASCTVTLPNGLMSGFNCSFSTQTGVTLTYALGGSVVLINNTGTTMAEKLSHTIVNTGVSNEYLTAGSL